MPRIGCQDRVKIATPWLTTMWSAGRLCFRKALGARRKARSLRTPAGGSLNLRPRRKAQRPDPGRGKDRTRVPLP